MSQAITISKEFRWEMGHRLPYHTAGCQNLHGHSYRLIVSLTGQPDETGMVLDFGDLSAVMRPILAQLDHSFMVFSEDTIVLDFLTDLDLKKTEVGFHSTAENIVSWLGEKLRLSFRDNRRLERVNLTLYETVSSAASVEVFLK